jgi:beta-galactosidase
MKTLFTEGWKFWEAPFGTDFQEAQAHIDDFKSVRIPHDYMITDTGNLYRDSTGWYTRDFEVSSSDLEKELVLIFDGIYMDSVVYVNGAEAGEWKYGYSQFVLNITEYVKEGTNTVFVAARCKFPNTRWYSGAGIYRDVWLCKYDRTYIPENGIYVHTSKAEDTADYRMYVNCEVTGPDRNSTELSYELYDATPKSIELAECTDEYGDVFEDTADTKHFHKCFLIKDVKEWDVKAPNLYSLKVTIKGGEAQEITIGFRDVSFNPEKGFFLNGRNMKLNGVCLHHDLGALGSAYNNTAMRRRLIQLREMGVNALRLTHNMYAPGVINLADEMGFLLISEAFDMWEGPKTEFDYARFFPAWHERDVASWVRRDRNHPSVILWSIGNEIYDTHASERGQEVTLDLKQNVEKHDPLFNGRATIGSNYMPWEMAQKCADILKLAGYNYAENYYEQHHKEHPDWVIYGSETYSIVQSRGIYHFPLDVPTLSDTDEQCSSLGNSTTSWGADSIEACICRDRDYEFSMGQFIWTGYDYIGEPTPYHTKNSYFGLIDTAGFYKDAFYAWKSAWTSCKEDPFVHVFPYWDFNEGQEVDVRVCSNAPFVELLVNGKSLGKKELTHAPHSGFKIFADYRLPYEKGEITAVAYDEEGREIARQTRKSFGDTESFKVEIDHRLDKYGAKDLLFAEISALDKDGNPVENASDYVKVAVKGGKLLGLDNGDSTDYDSYQSDVRKLFVGKLLAIVEPEGDPSDVEIVVEKAEKVPVRTVKLEVIEGSRNLDDKNSKARVRAHIYPENATHKDLVFRALNKNGTEANVAKAVADGNECTVEALGDGSFTLRCEAYDGREVVSVMSFLDFEITGIGAAYLDPYGFIPGSVYTSHIGVVGNGNEHGVASARGEATVISYSGIDFGKEGSDEITVPIFTLNDDAYDFEVWKGIPGEDDAKLLKAAVYQKKSIWNVYQPDTWTLSERLTGIQTISFKVYQKFHIKGFSFTRQLRAFTDIKTVDADSIYGDTFTRKEDTVEGIGNNVTLAFDEIDFGQQGTDKVVLLGRTPNAANTVHLRLVSCDDPSVEIKEILEFPGGSEYKEVEFAIGERKGKWNITFVFLPGSNFDFKSFRFIPEQV